jgi:hypothetical protein
VRTWRAVGTLVALNLAMAASARQAAGAAPSQRPDASHPRVVLLASSAEDATVARVHDELRALGFEVQFEPTAGPPDDLASVARREGAAAAAYVERWPPEVVIWVDPTRAGGDPGSGNLIHVGDSFSEATRTELLALRAVELLRGKLLPLSQPSKSGATAGSTEGDSRQTQTGSAEQPPAGPPGVGVARKPANPDSVTSEADDGKHDSRHGTISVGPALLLSPGGVPAMPQIRVAGGYNLGWRIGFEGSLSIPTTEATVSADAGDVGLRSLALAGSLTVEITPEDMDFGLLGGLGMGATALFFDGEAGPPFAGARGTRWAAAPQAQLAAHYRFHPLLAVRVDVVASLLRPEPIVRIAGQEVASFGQPAVLMALGLEVLP